MKFSSPGCRPWSVLAGLSLMVAGPLLSGCALGSHGPVPPSATAQPVAGVAGAFHPPEPPSGYTPKTLAFGQAGMVVAAHPLATQAGQVVLASGGSAVDAAIAMQMVLNVVEPQSSGIGGGAFLLHFDAATRQLLAYDGRETAPAAATPDMFLRADGQPLGFAEAVDSGLSVGTPGLVRMLELAHRAHGRRPWAELLAPAIGLAQDGFAISPRLHASIAGSATRIGAQGEPLRSLFLNADGSAKAAGTWLRNPELAATLRRLAAGGAQAFYTGDLAQAMVIKVTGHPQRPGRLSLADLAGYTAQVRTPVCGVYRVHYRVCGMPPPSSGGITTLQTLGLLSHFDVAALEPLSVDAVHLLSEAYRLAYADRARYVADADFVPVPVAGLLAPAYLAQRARLIRMDRSLGVAPVGQPAGAPLASGMDASLNLPSTSHLSVVDRDGHAVSMTTSIENGFGSLQMVGGFLLNNQLTDFSLRPADASGPVANRVEPGKRPRSSMAPTVVLNAHTGELEAVVGSPGGSAIIQYVSQALVGLLDWRLDMQQAVSLPHFGAQTSAATVLEQGSAIDTPAMYRALAARGHTVQAMPFTSGLHGVVFNGWRADGHPGPLARHPGAGQWAGGADPRREGVAAGVR